ncbi:thioester-forming surface-anchored protein [Streptococcus halichoeri]|uniref:thioester-forming surface-anchored protein n=1 Tax=Streptococcus halichoeri TaxID=254785 RepID=UPI0013580E15|nr:thioester-forming surface-anchored protein [Streptococcus halichoeri]
MLAASAACFIFSISSAGGSLQVWAEDYYGWNDGTRNQSPFFLYVTPKDNSTRSTEDKYVVYCFNKEKHWPDQWEATYNNFNEIRAPYNDLPIYEKKLGYDSIFKQHAPDHKKEIDDIGGALVAVLSKGYPTVKNIENLDETSSRKITQLAIWYFTDSFPKSHFKENYSLSDVEDKALQNLIAAGENPNLDESQKKQTLDLYIYKSGGTEHRYNYQNLLGSTLIPKIPASETEIHSNLLLLEEDNLSGIISGGVGSVETLEESNTPIIGQGGGLADLAGDTHYPAGEKVEAGAPQMPGTWGKNDSPLQGLEGEQSPLITKNHNSTEKYPGQSEILIETEDSKIPHIMGHGGKLAGEAGEAGETQQAGQTGGHTPTIEITQDTQEGRSGSCASQTETEDTQKPTVIMGSQGQPIETSESTQGGMSGQSGNATETDDTKQPDVILGGQGHVIDISEHSSAGMSGSCDPLTTLEDAEHSTADSDTKQAGKERRLPQTSDQEHLLLSLLMPVILLLISLRAIFKYPFKDNN